VRFGQDVYGRDVDRRYFRDADGREVDFVVTERGQPIRLVECELGDREIDIGLEYLARHFTCGRSCLRARLAASAAAARDQADAWQISLDCAKDYVTDYITDHGIRAAPALALLRELV
jgi:hypothetical protein